MGGGPAAVAVPQRAVRVRGQVGGRRPQAGRGERPAGAGVAAVAGDRAAAVADPDVPRVAHGHLGQRRRSVTRACHRGAAPPASRWYSVEPPAANTAPSAPTATDAARPRPAARTRSRLPVVGEQAARRVRRPQRAHPPGGRLQQPGVPQHRPAGVGLGQVGLGGGHAGPRPGEGHHAGTGEGPDRGGAGPHRPVVEQGLDAASAQAGQHRPAEADAEVVRAPDHGVLGAVGDQRLGAADEHHLAVAVAGADQVHHPVREAAGGGPALQRGQGGHGAGAVRADVSPGLEQVEHAADVGRAVHAQHERWRQVGPDARDQLRQGRLRPPARPLCRGGVAVVPHLRATEHVQPAGPDRPGARRHGNPARPRRCPCRAAARRR